jgi:hypothetical protein
MLLSELASLQKVLCANEYAMVGICPAADHRMAAELSSALQVPTRIATI